MSPRSAKLQFSLLTMLAAFVPFALLFGWLAGRIRFDEPAKPRGSEILWNGSSAKLVDVALPTRTQSIELALSSCRIARKQGTKAELDLAIEQGAWDKLSEGTIASHDLQRLHSGLRHVSEPSRLRIYIQVSPEAFVDHRSEWTDSKHLPIRLAFRMRSPNGVGTCGDDMYPCTSIDGTRLLSLCVGSAPASFDGLTDVHSDRILPITVFTTDDAYYYRHVLKLNFREPGSQEKRERNTGKGRSQTEISN